MAATGEALPPRLERRWAKIRELVGANAHLLARQGSLVAKPSGGRARWCLRFCERGPDGRGVHRSVYVGSDPELLRRTRLLLQGLRARAAWEAQTAALAKLVTAPGTGLQGTLARLRPARRATLGKRVKAGRRG